MKLTQVVVIGCVAASVQGCAMLNAVRSGNPNAVAAAGAELAAKQKAAKEKTDAACAHIKQDVVGFTEERAIGGVIGVSLVSQNGTLFLEGMTEKDPAVLSGMVEKKEAVTLPDNAVNDMTAYVSVVGKNLAKYSTRPDLPWTFAVIENDAINAFSAPGGYVVVTTGLLKKIANEAQLAGVLSHEISHVVLKHSINKYIDAKDTQCRLVHGTANAIEAGIPLPPGAGEGLAKFKTKFDGQMDLDNSEPDFITLIMKGLISLLQAGNDKDSEFAADAGALSLTAFAGYDPTEYEKFLVSLGNQGGFFSLSHPATSDRVAKLKALREGDLAPFCNGTAKPDVAGPFAPLKPKS